MIFINSDLVLSYRLTSYIYAKLAHFISKKKKKIVQEYETVKLAKNTIRTFKSLHRIVKAFEHDQSEILYLNSIDKYTAESVTISVFLLIIPAAQI